jgi:hypothetical protein
MGKKQQILIPLALGMILSIMPIFSYANSGASRSPTPKAPAIAMSNEAAFYEYQCRKRPKNAEPQEEVLPVDSSVKYINQSDSFGSAADQATYLAIYQMSVGPYGKLQSEEDRNKLLKETAQAIDDCVNGRSCGEDKQKKVLKALVQLNQGLELRCMMIANQHNQERMKTAKSAEEEIVDPATYETTEFQYQKAANSWKFEKTKTTTEMQRGYGVRDGDHFKLEENAVKHTIVNKEQEILGESFVRDYGIFIDNYTNTQREDNARYYKFVPVGEANYRFDDDGGQKSVDQERFEVAMREQSAKDIQSAVSGYKEKVSKAKVQVEMVDVRGPNGVEKKAKANIGVDFQEVGMGFNPGSVPEIPELNVEDLKQDGKFTAEGKPKAVVRYINEQFRITAERQKQQRDIASANDPSAPLKQIGYTNVTLNPQKFDEFLDEIWPTGEKREQQRRGIFPPPPPTN